MYNKITEITSKQYTDILDNAEYGYWEPYGLFFVRDGNSYIGIDNSTGECWTEEFTSFSACKKWLSCKELGAGTANSFSKRIKFSTIQKIKSNRLLVRLVLTLERRSKQLNHFIGDR